MGSGLIESAGKQTSKFSVIVALYNVEKYLNTFLNSIIRQSYPCGNLEIVIVDDGSTDSSYDLVRLWATKYPDLIRHTTKSNGGPASARNMGLGLARYEWVAFCDPDDALDEHYFQRVADFIKRDRENLATMLTTRVMIWQEESKRIKNTHPLGRKFSFGEQLVDLNVNPNYAQLGGASIFLQRDLIEKNDLRLSELIKPTFEDAEFIGRYLACAPRQVVGVIPSAKYLYRKRGDGSSLVQSSWLKTERYHDVLEHGYLALLSGLYRKLGYVPDWAQNMVLYDMCWYLIEETKMRSASAWVEGDLLKIFHDLLKQIFSYIDRNRIESYNMSGMLWITRQAMLTFYKGNNLFPQHVVRWSHSNHGPNLVGYAYAGRQPIERFVVDGEEVVPVESKSVRHDYFGETYFLERKVWLPQGTKTEVWLDGRYTKFVPSTVKRWDKVEDSLKLGPVVRTSSQPNTVWGRSLARFAPSAVSQIYDKARSRVGTERLVSESTVVQATATIARRIVSRNLDANSKALSKKRDATVRQWGLSDANRKRYRGAWILIDRPDHAGDNAEHLYRYLMGKQPQINAFFLLERESNDWDRLENEGFQLIEYGSRESVAAVLNSVVQISSDATAEVQFPIGRKRYGAYVERFVFLQHGITMNDLSRWLNQKQIALICSATADEYEAFVADEGAYNFTRSQVALTGFPRFDELVRRNSDPVRPVKKTIMIMPTWRQSLKDGLAGIGSSKERANFLRESEYGRAWIDLLSSDEFLQVGEDAGLEVVFVPHPAISEFVSLFDLPSSVRVVRHEDISLQEMFVSSVVLITDYSSVAFDVGFLGTPVIYYQFDSGEIFSGKHNFRKGYFDYEADGLGPVVYTVDQAIDAVSSLSVNGFELPEIFRRRKEGTFKYTDANSSQRVYLAVEDRISRP